VGGCLPFVGSAADLNDPVEVSARLARKLGALVAQWNTTRARNDLYFWPQVPMIMPGGVPGNKQTQVIRRARDGRRLAVLSGKNERGIKS
jgi:hypothetical protein